MKKLDHHSRHENGTGDLPSGHPFKVPDGYFDGLPSEVNSRIHTRKGFAISWLMDPFKVSAAIGFVVIAFFSAAHLGFFNQAGQHGIQEDPVIILTISEVMLSGIDQDLIYEAIQSYDDISADPPDEGEAYLEEFLIENDIETTLIINEL